MSRIRRLIAYAGLALLCIVSILFFSDSSEDILGTTNIVDSTALPYAVVHNASTRYFNKDGSLSYTFQSDKLSHFRASETIQSIVPQEGLNESYTEVDTPNIVFFENDIPWKIQAESARIAESKVITLSDNVIVRHQDEDGLNTTMRTSELTFDPQQKLARTDQTVTIESPIGLMSAIGMRADIANRKISLNKNVKGRHQPQTKGP